MVTGAAHIDRRHDPGAVQLLALRRLILQLHQRANRDSTDRNRLDDNVLSANRIPGQITSCPQFVAQLKARIENGRVGTASGETGLSRTFWHKILTAPELRRAAQYGPSAAQHAAGRAIPRAPGDSGDRGTCPTNDRVSLAWAALRTIRLVICVLPAVKRGSWPAPRQADTPEDSLHGKTRRALPIFPAAAVAVTRCVVRIKAIGFCEVREKSVCNAQPLIVNCTACCHIRGCADQPRWPS